MHAWVLAEEVVKELVSLNVKLYAMELAKVLVLAEQNVNKNKYSYCLFSSITEETVKPLIAFLQDIEDKSILDLYINSQGGLVLVAIGIFNFIKSIKGLKINTYNIGHCDSAATLLFFLGNKRYATKNSSFFMHSLQVSLSKPQTINSLQAEINNLKADKEAFVNLLAKNSKITKKQWNSYMSDKGSLIKAKKALEIGIIDAIYEEQNFELIKRR